MTLITRTILTAVLTGTSLTAMAVDPANTIEEPGYLNYNFASTASELTVDAINRINELQPSASGDRFLEPGYLNYNYSSVAPGQSVESTFDEATLQPLYNNF